MVWKDGSKAGAQIVKGTATDISAENWQGEVYAASNKVSINGFFVTEYKVCLSVYRQLFGQW